MIPLVFWLALIANETHTDGTVTISPIPFATQEDCERAAEFFVDAAGSSVSPVCYPQRKDDVITFQAWAGGYTWTKDYTR